MRVLNNVENELRFIINRRFDGVVKNLIGRLEAALATLQSDFFTIMAQKTMGVSKPPSLAQYTPMWKPLNSDYVERREDETGVTQDKFFEHSGAMEGVLSSLNAATVFGKPLVTYQQTVKASVVLKDLRGRITIDLYPKVMDIDALDEANYFKQKIISRKGSKLQTTPLSYRLKNFQGKLDRPFVQEYMKWWLNYRAKSLIRKVAGLSRNG